MLIHNIIEEKKGQDTIKEELQHDDAEYRCGQKDFLQFFYQSVSYNGIINKTGRPILQPSRFGTHEGARTSDLPLRRRPLYPTELRGLMQ